MMSNDPNQINQLRQEILHSLESTLSPDGETRNTAERRLKALDVIEMFPIHLLEFVFSPALSPPIRQLASVILRQYVDCHWSTLSEKFVPPEPSNEVKANLRHLLPDGLRESQSKIRNAVAAVICSIAHWDWPEAWPNLFDVLMEHVRDEKAVNGAMRVMTEFTKEFTDQHMIEMAPILLPEMLKILQNSQAYSVRTRTRAVDIFRICASMLAVMHDLDKSVVGEIFDPFHEPFLMAFTSALQEDRPSGTGYPLQKAIVKTITSLLRHFPKKIMPYLPTVLAPIWKILTTTGDTFLQYIRGDPGDNEIDSDGEQCGAESVIFSVLDLVNNLAELPAVSGLVKNWLQDLMYYTVFYMQIPQERIETWSVNPAAFAADEDEDTATYTLRVCALDLLVLISDEFPDECLAALGEAVNRHLQTSNDCRVQEACLAAVSAVASKIVRPAPSPPAGTDVWKKTFDIHGFIHNVICPGLTSHDILISGRSLILGSSFSTVLSPELTRHFVRVATEHIVDPNRLVVSRILAAKAISLFVNQAMDNLTVKTALLEVLPAAMDSFISFATTQSVEILSSFLETMVGILSLDEAFTASIAQKMTTLTIACFVKFNSDPTICPTLENIVQELCANKACFIEIENRFTPTIISVLSNQSDGLGGPKGVALDMLTLIIRSSQPPLSPLLIQSAFPAVVTCVANSDDHTVLQNAGECLRAFISSAPDQIVEYRDSMGVPGLVHVVQFACRLLDPTTSEFSASFAGRLVTTLIIKTGDKLGDQLELLLRGVLSKLQSADTFSVIQNLCMVYAHLINTQLEAALNFLENVPGPEGYSALHFVLTEWVSRQQCFFGVFDRKVSSIALCKILQFAVNTNDQRLAVIEVKGDPIFDPNTRMSTRSKKVLEQWTQIPLLVKIFKLIIYELACSASQDYETESEDSDEDDDKENYTRDLGEDAFFDEFAFVDADIKNDPLYSIDLENYLLEYLKEFSNAAFYPEFLRHANAEELKILNNCGIACSVPS